MGCKKCTDSEQAHVSTRVNLLASDVSVGYEPCNTQRAQQCAAATILLLGNPNVGKSTLFNTLTGAHQSVCNAPGTTVEVFAGKWKALEARLIDMPGTYSLLPNSPDEEVVVSTISGTPSSLTDPATTPGASLLVCVLDATSLSRSLYLLAQAAQTGLPTICVLTMQDIAAQTGEAVNVEDLSQVLGVPVLSVDPRHKKGLHQLEQAVREALRDKPRVRSLNIDPYAPGYNASVVGCLKKLNPEALEGRVETADMGEVERASKLFNWISETEHALNKLADTPRELGKVSRSDRVDRMLLNPWFGIPVFMVAMYIVFWLCNTFAAVFQDPIEGLFDKVGGWDFTIPADLLGIPGTSIGWPADDITLFHAPSIADGVSALFANTSWAGGFIENILIKGLLTGIGVVGSFAPLMIVMFLAIAFMEDCGYMARVAFLGDRIMRVIGLDGRVIMPFVVGFGCNLPTLAALRTLPNTRQRIMAVILTPYITCNARMVVYIFIARIFFADYTAEVVWVMYFASVLMIFLGGLALKPLLLKQHKNAPLMLVLPPYQQPRSFILLRSSAKRTWAFLTGAGRVIIVMTIVVWVLMVAPVAGDGHFGEEIPPEDSAYGYVSGAIAPIFKPAGFDDWHIAGSLITGFVAKETMLGALATTYQAAPGVCTEQEKELADTYQDLSDEDTADDVAKRFTEHDELFADYPTEKAAYDAVQKAFEKRCAGLHLGTAEEDSTPTNSMQSAVKATFLKTTGSPTRANIAAFAFLIFVLTYTPCLATVSEQWRQLGRRCTLAAVGVQLVTAWLLAVIVYQVGAIIFA